MLQLLPGKVACSDPPIRDLAAAVRVTCSNPSCPTSRLMHAKCFAKFEDKICAALAKIGRGRSWTDKQVLLQIFLSIKTKNVMDALAQLYAIP